LALGRSLNSQLAAPRAIRPCQSQQSPVLSVVSFSEICLDTTLLIALFTAAHSSHRGLEHGKGRLGLVDVKLYHSWALIGGAPHKSSKASEPGTNECPLHPSTIRLSKYNNQSRHTCPFRGPTTILIASAGAPLSRSSPFPPPREPPLLPPTNIYIFLSRYPYHFSLHTTDLIPPFRFVARETAGPNPSPVLHGPLLTRLWYRKHNAIGCKLNLSLSLPRGGSRIGYDAMICTTTMRRHALLLIALAHSTHFLGPRCGAIAMMLFLSHPLVLVGTRALTPLTHNTPRYDISKSLLCQWAAKPLMITAFLCAM
jgi:hypothetical protein